MECPVCKIEAVISESKNVFKQDEGKLFRAMTFSCRNKKCTEFQKKIGVQMDEIPISIE